MAELKSACKGVSEYILACNVATFFGQQLDLRRHCVDANACRGIILRQGAGPVKHLDMRQLWIQESVQDYQITVDKIPRNANTADFLCSPSTEGELEKRLLELQSTVYRISSSGYPSVSQFVGPVGRKKRARMHM